MAACAAGARRDRRTPLFVARAAILRLTLACAYKLVCWSHRPSTHWNAALRSHTHTSSGRRDTESQTAAGHTRLGAAKLQGTRHSCSACFPTITRRTSSNANAAAIGSESPRHIRARQPQNAERFPCETKRRDVEWSMAPGTWPRDAGGTGASIRCFYLFPRPRPPVHRSCRVVGELGGSSGLAALTCILGAGSVCRARVWCLCNTAKCQHSDSALTQDASLCTLALCARNQQACHLADSCWELAGARVLCLAGVKGASRCPRGVRFRVRRQVEGIPEQDIG